MAKTIDYKKLLKKLDEEYFDYMIEWPSSIDDVCYVLATYAYDCDFDFDDGSWKELEEIRKLFGQKVWFQTLKNLFMRHHDT